MRVAISAQGIDVESAVDPRFGRCRYFVIVDPDTLEYEAVANPNIGAVGGAGIQAVRFLADRNVGAVLTGNVGPNAAAALEAAGIKVFTGIGGSIKEALRQYREGKLSSSSRPSVPSHFGMSGVQDGQPTGGGSRGPMGVYGSGRRGGGMRGGGRGGRLGGGAGGPGARAESLTAAVDPDEKRGVMSSETRDIY